MYGGNPVSLDQALSLASEALRTGRFEQAERLCQQVLAIDPQSAAAYRIWGTAAYLAQRMDAAAEFLHRAASLEPADAVVRAQLGEALRSLGRLDEAIPHARAATRLDPTNAPYHLALGHALRDAGDAAGAIAAYRDAVTLAPGFGAAWYALGQLHADRGEWASAMESFEQLEQAGHPDAWTLAADAAVSAGQLTRAEAAYRRGLALTPDDPVLHGHFGNLLLMTGRGEDALAAFRHSLRLAPARPVIESNVLLAMNYSDRVSPQEVFEAHRRWGAAVEARIAPIRDHDNDLTPGRRLRVGYVSPDFCDHAVWKWFEPLLLHHDRGRFDVVCYSAVRRPDTVTARARQLAPEWRDIADLSDDDAAALVRRDRIDVLVDLAGHTRDNRLLLLARRPAPVQITYLGYPNTTGLTRIDYLITDDHLDPPGQTQRYHTEKLLRLPHCFSCYRPPADAPDVTPLPALSAGFITFGGATNLAKLSPATFDLWAAVLRDVASSRLLLKSSHFMDAGLAQRLAAEFTARGVDARRIEFAGRTPSHSSHLAACARIDVALDTFPYHGTTGTCDALWMGVPVVTRAGETHPSRAGVTILRALDLPHLAAASDADFARTAAALAADLPALAALRADLRPRMARSSLTDAKAFTGRLEQALESAWADYRAGIAGK